MPPPARRSQGRAVPPTPPALPVLPVTLDDDPFGTFGTIALHFAPPLTLAEFQRVAVAHGLVAVPTADEPQLFCLPERVEVAYGYRCVTPLPPQVTTLVLCGADGPNAPAVLALAEAMLAAWPSARWQSDGGFTPLLLQRAPGRQMPRRRARR
ncbi:MAG: hypothetical protein WCG26_16625 [Chloroflexales bacterium]